jgi:hypothetical protein
MSEPTTICSDFWYFSGSWSNSGAALPSAAVDEEP